MLYLDQPVQVGFSYDSLINGTIEETASPFVVTPYNATQGSPNIKYHAYCWGLSSQKVSNTANTTSTAALAAWHFMQIWIHEYATLKFLVFSKLSEAPSLTAVRFPEYKPKDYKFIIWSQSYGGHYSPTFSDLFESQNRRIENGSINKASAIPLNLETVGLVNACIDILTQMPTYPDFAYNNTYSIQAINESQYQFPVDSFPECRKHVETCHSVAKEYDPLAL